MVLGSQQAIYHSGIATDTQVGHFLKVWKGKRGNMKIFLAPRVLGRFSLFLAPFSKLYQFQITTLQSITYLKNTPSPTRLQRLPRSKKALCDPL